jgi:hypothetical protein
MNRRGLLPLNPPPGKGKAQYLWGKEKRNGGGLKAKGIVESFI